MDDIDELLQLDERELDLAIGNAILLDSMGFEQASDSEKLETARSWFDSRRWDLQVAVCSSPAVQSYLRDGKGAERELFDAVLAAVGMLTGIPIPLSYLAAKTIRYGLERLCGGQPESPNEPVRS